MAIDWGKQLSDGSSSGPAPASPTPTGKVSWGNIFKSSGGAYAPQQAPPAVDPATADHYKSYFQTLAKPERQNFLDSLGRTAKTNPRNAALLDTLSPTKDAPQTDKIEEAKPFSGKWSFLNNAVVQGGGRVVSNAVLGLARGALPEGAAGATDDAERKLSENYKAGKAPLTGIKREDVGNQPSNLDAAKIGLLDKLLFAKKGPEAAMAVAKVAQRAYLAKFGADQLKDLPDTVKYMLDRKNSLTDKIEVGGGAVVGAGLILHSAHGEYKDIKGGVDRLVHPDAVTIASGKEVLRQATENYDKSGRGLPAPTSEVKALPEGVSAKGLPDGGYTTPGGATTVKNPQVAELPTTKQPSTVDGKIAAIDKKLADFKEGRATDMTPETAKKLQLQRSNLGALTEIAQTEAKQSGIPVEQAHAKLAMGQSELSPVYQHVLHDGTLEGDVPIRTADMQKVAKTSIGKVAQGIKDIISPASSSKIAAETAQGAREAMAQGALAGEVEHLQNKSYEKFFKDVKDPIANNSSFERTGQFDQQPDPAYHQFYKASTDAAHEIGARVYGEDKIGYIENFIHRQFKFGSDAASTEGMGLLRKMAGDKSVLKGRTLDIPIDEALAKMKAAGIDVKLSETNPETLRQWTVANAARADAFDQAFKGWKSAGIISTERQPGMVALPQDTMRAISPTAGGEHFVYPDALRVLKNTVGVGLKQNAGYQGLREINGSLTQLKLGLSAYHAGMTAVTDSVGKVANAIMQTGSGDFKGAGKSLAKAPVASVNDLLAGRKFVNDIADNNPETMNVLRNAGIPGGARLGLTREYQSNMTSKMITAFNEGGIGAVLKNPLRPFGAVIEQVSRPLMEYAIPRVKMGAFLDRAGQIAKQYGVDITSPHAEVPPAMKFELAKAWDSVDNRLGEIVHDNRFWNKSVKDLAQLSYLSLGYKAGTISELGGGAGDLLHGKLTERSSFLIALPITVGLTGAFYQMARGQGAPQDLKDYFYPKTGQNDASGNPIRAQLPSYMKDAIKMSTNPVGELAPNNPLMTFLWSLGANQDYKKDYIYDPNAGAMQKAGEIGKAAVDQLLMPISFQNGVKNQNQGAERSLESFFGITTAPKSVDTLPMLQKLYKQLPPSGPKTPAEQAAKVGKAPVSPADTFKHLPTPKKIDFIKSLTPEERKQFDFSQWITESVNSLKSGKEKDPNGVKSALDLLGTSRDKYQSELDKGKAQRHQNYLNGKLKPKAKSQL